MAEGWCQSESDPSMFTWHDKNTGSCIGVIYVDDGIIAGPRVLVEELFAKLAAVVEVTDMGEPKDFLGMHCNKQRYKRHNPQSNTDC